MHQCASTRAPETALHARASHDRISAALEIEVRPVLDATNAVHVFVERLSPVEPREGGLALIHICTCRRIGKWCFWVCPCAYK